MSIREPFNSRDPEPDDGAYRRALRDLGYEPVKLLTIKPTRRAYRVRRKDSSYAIKFWAAEEGPVPYPVAVHRDLLTLIGGPHRRLVVPECVDLGFDERVGHYAVLTWLDGEDFHSRWHYHTPATAGGRAIDLSTIHLVLELLQDLVQLPAERLIRAGLRQYTRGHLEKESAQHLSTLDDEGVVSGEQATRAQKLLVPLLEEDEELPWMASNEDFRFANFLELSPARTGVVDWDGARASKHELEHCLAYLCLFMWNRRDWQRQLLQRARSTFSHPFLQRQRFRAVLLLSALRQTETWRVDPPRRQHPLDLFLETIDDRCFGDLWF